MWIFTKTLAVDSGHLSRFQVRDEMLLAYTEDGGEPLILSTGHGVLRDFKKISAGLFSQAAFIFLEGEDALRDFVWHIGDYGILTEALGDALRFSAGCVVQIYERNDSVTQVSIASMPGGNLATVSLFHEDLPVSQLRRITPEDLSILKARYEESRSFPDYEGYAAACQVILGKTVAKLHCQGCDQLVLPVNTCPRCGASPF